MDIMIVLLIILLIFFSILCISYFFDKNSLFILYSVFLIVSYFLSFKIVTIQGININLASLTLSGLFVIFYLILDKGLKKDIAKIKKLTLFLSILVLMYIGVINCYIPGVNDILSPNINGLLGNNVKYSISFFLTLNIGIYLGSYLYNELKKIKVNSYLNIILNYIIVCFFTVIVNYLISYINLLNFGNIVILITANFIIRCILNLASIVLIILFKGNRRLKL